MLKSLLGELYPPRELSRSVRPAPFTATDFEPSQPAVSDSGWHATSPPRRAERVEVTLPVSEPLLDSLRLHLGRHREVAWRGQGVITIVDPLRMWAPGVVKAMAEAAGQFVDRMHVQDRATGHAFAVIESTTVLRRGSESVLICHPQGMIGSAATAAVTEALMECADLTVFVIAPQSGSLIDEQEHLLRSACASAHWTCSEVLFMLPPGSREVADRLDRGPWPQGVRVRCTMEPLTSTGSVWSALLAHWQRVQPGRAATPLREPLFRERSESPPSPSLSVGASANSGFGALPALHELPLHSGSMPLYPITGPGVGSTAPVPLGTPEARPARAKSHPSTVQVTVALEGLNHVDGLLFAALVDVRHSVLLATVGEAPPAAEVDTLPQRVAQVVSAHRASLNAFGHIRTVSMVEEILVTVGGRYHIVRGLPSYPDCYLLGVADKLRSNLAMTRVRILEVQKALA